MKPHIKFHYKKSNLFRVIHAEGAYGGLTPEANVFFTFFNSRPPIPETLVQELSEDGQLGREVADQRVCKDGIVREVEVGVLMSPKNVRSLIEFLQQLEKKAEEFMAADKAGQGSAADAVEIA